MGNSRNLTPEQLEHKRQRAREYYWENVEECRRKKREEAAADRAKARKRCAEYHRKHYVPKIRKRKTEEEIKAHDRKRNGEYHRNNRGKISIRKRRYYEANREKFASSEYKKRKSQFGHDYYRAHKEKWAMTREKKDRANELERKRRAESPEEAEKHRREVKDWIKKNPHKVKERRLKVYGITLEEFNALLKFQGGVCVICGYSDRSNPKIFPFVDHSHSAKHVRGILCSRCNHGLGNFRDSPALLRKAAKYLEKNALFGPIQK